VCKEAAMLRPEETGERVYLHRAPIDMRKQRSGLAALVQEVINVDPFSSAIFLFIGKRYDRIKILWWDRNGFVVWYKVIEGKEKFHWPRHASTATVTLSAEQLRWLLEGYDVWRMKPHKMLHFSHAS
jgi:transposase